MPPKQRQIKSQGKAQYASMMQAMEQLEKRSDEELAREQRYRSAAQAILGSRAAERYDAAATREHFRQAIASARPQERMAIRRMADASLALAERRADDLKVAVERLGQQAPSTRQLLLLRLFGFLMPGRSAPLWKRARGLLSFLLLVVAVIAAGALIVKVVALPFGGVSWLSASWLGILLVIVALVVLTVVGRRRQARARAG